MFLIIINIGILITLNNYAGLKVVEIFLIATVVMLMVYYIFLKRWIKKIWGQVLKL
jgi:hypothetical protein